MIAANDILCFCGFCSNWYYCFL